MKTKTSRKRKLQTPQADLPQGQAPTLSWADVITAFDAVYPGMVRSGTVYLRTGVTRGMVFADGSGVSRLINFALGLGRTKEEFDGYINAALNAMRSAIPEAVKPHVQQPKARRPKAGAR